MASTNTKKRSRCPNGQRKNPKTGNCEHKKSKVNGNNNKSKKVAFRKVAKRSTKPSAKQRARGKLMLKELMELSGPYQAHKKEQVVKKALAKKIKANNLQRAKKSLKSRNSKNSKNNKPTKKRKRCPNGQRKNKKGECVSKK